MKRILYHPIVITIITILVFLVFFNLRGKLKRLTLSQENITNYQSRISQLEKKVAEKQAVQTRQTITVEKITRDELLTQKEDEVIIKLPEIKIKEEAEAQQQLKTPPFHEWQILLLNDLLFLNVDNH